MRSCQICGESDRRLIFAGYDEQNMSLFACDGCGHRYVDSAQLNQAWFDQYYKTQYKTSDTPYSFDRYSMLSKFVAGLGVVDVLDIGGLDGELEEHFKIHPLNYEAMGVGQQPAKKYDCVIASHVLEHVYDISPFMTLIRSALGEGGLLVVEVPYHKDYANPRAYDYHFQHLNKFRIHDLHALFARHGFPLVSSQDCGDYREYHCWRICGKIQ